MVGTKSTNNHEGIPITITEIVRDDKIIRNTTATLN